MMETLLLTLSCLMAQARRVTMWKPRPRRAGPRTTPGLGKSVVINETWIAIGEPAVICF